jgi:frataxin
VEAAVTSALEDAVPGLDVSLAMGVLTLRLGDGGGTYVLNKQTPNRQLWWSSPLSGPRRYGWDAGTQRWINSRDDHDMLAALAAELKAVTNVDVPVG